MTPQDYPGATILLSTEHLAMRSGKPAFRRALVSCDFLQKPLLHKRLDLGAEYLDQKHRSLEKKHSFAVREFCDGLWSQVLIFHDALLLRGIPDPMHPGRVSISTGLTSASLSMASRPSRNATHGMFNGLQGREACLAVTIEDIEPVQ